MSLCFGLTPNHNFSSMCQFLGSSLADKARRPPGEKIKQCLYGEKIFNLIAEDFSNAIPTSTQQDVVEIVKNLSQWVIKSNHEYMKYCKLKVMLVYSNM